jgi:hypothetical protein
MIGTQPDAGVRPDAACAGAMTTITLGARTGGTGQASMADTFLISDSFATRNYGAATTLVLCNLCDAEGLPWNDSTAVALLRFDTSALCPGSTILNATLELDTTDDNLGSGAVGVFTLLESWTEGNNAGSAGVANWSQRTAGAPWTNQGAGPPSSREDSLLVEFSPTATSEPYSVAIPATTVQTWLEKPTMNFGLALAISRGTSDVQFVSREGADAAKRPGLKVTVQLP